MGEEYGKIIILEVYLYLYKYENVCVSVCLCVFAFFLAIWNPIGIGIPFTLAQMCPLTLKWL